MKLHHIYIVFFLCCFSCSNRYKQNLEAVDLVPKSHTTIIKANRLENLSTLNQDLVTLEQLQIDSLIPLTHIINTDKPIYFSFSKSNSALITKYTDSLIKIDSTLNIKINKTDKKNIFQTIIEKDTVYHKTLDSLFFVSKSIELVNSINKDPNTELREYFATATDQSTVSVVFKNRTENRLLFDATLKDSLKFEVLDINTEAKNLTFNGVTKSVDRTFKINAFKNTIPQTFNLAKIIPADVKSVSRIAFDDYTIFSKNRSELLDTTHDSISTILNLTNEIAQIELDSGNAIVINYLDTEVIDTEIDMSSIAESYKGIEIFNFAKSDFFNQRLYPFIKLENVSHGFILENFLVLSSDVNTLKNIITNKLSNNTLSNSDKFESISDKIASASSYLIYKNGKAFTDYLGKNPEGYNANVVQYIYDTDFAHINGIYSKYKKGGSKNSVTEDFSFKITNEILVEPQTVKNYVSGGHDIVVQDITNTLYQISNSGRTIWKKKIDGPILGKIEQIDIFKNGRLQLAFATKNRIYVIDRKGKGVSPFPMKFSDDITQPLSVFDYDNRKNYRLLVTQNNQLLMYDAKGKRVNGFKYNKAANEISSQPKHFRINSKDYIVFSQGKKLEILNRQGKERIKVNGEINFSDSEIFNYQNRFVTKTENGSLMQVDTNGKLKPINNNLNADSKITTTSKTLVALTENKLKIKTKTVDLDFGNYTAPNLFYLNDKIYVTVTDLQAKKVFVYDSQAKLLPNFPVYGTSSATLEKLGKNRDISLITQSDNQSIIVYKLN